MVKHLRRSFPCAVAGVILFCGVQVAFAQYDYYDPYSNSSIDYFPMNPVYTSPSSSGSTGSTGDTSGKTTDTVSAEEATYTSTYCANKPLANPMGTRSVEIRDKAGKVFYLSPPKEELTGYRSYPETSQKIFKVVYDAGGVEVGVEDVGLVTVRGTCYPKYGYVKDPAATAPSSATTVSSSGVTSVTANVVPDEATAVTLDAATGKVYNAATGVLIADARYDAVTRKIFYKDTDSTFGKVFTETTGYVNIDTRGVAASSLPTATPLAPSAGYQHNETDLDFVRTSLTPSASVNPGRDEPTARMTPPEGGGKNENGDFEGEDELRGAVKDDAAPDFTLRGGDVRGWDSEKKEAFLRDRKDAAQVRSGQDLEYFAAGVLLDDAAIQGVEFNEQFLELESEEEGKLFWLVPVTFTSRVVIKLTPADGAGRGKAVFVRFPWWSVFVKKTYSADVLEGELRGAIDTFAWEKVDNSETPIIAKGAADTIGTFDPTKWETLARTLGLVSNIMKTRHDTAKNTVSNLR